MPFPSEEPYHASLCWRRSSFTPQSRNHAGLQHWRGREHRSHVRVWGSHWGVRGFCRVLDDARSWVPYVLW